MELAHEYVHVTGWDHKGSLLSCSLFPQQMEKGRSGEPRNNAHTVT